MSMRWRLTLWYLGTFLLLLVSLTAVFYWQTRRTLIAQIDQTLALATAQAQARLLPDQIVFADELSLLAAINHIDSNLTVQLVDADGVVLEQIRNSEEDEDAAEPPDPLPVVAPVAEATSQRVRDQGWRVFSMPTVDPAIWVQAIQSLDPIEDVLATLLAQLAWGIPLALILAGGGGYWLAGRALQPIAHITHTAQTISTTDLSQRIAYSGVEDEIGRLATTFDEMLDRLQAGFERERRFTGDAAHELRTPLATLKSSIEVTLGRERTPATYAEVLSDMGSEVERLIALSNDLLFIARLDQQTELPLDDVIELGTFLGALVEQLAPLAADRQITIEEDIPALTIRGNLDLLIRLFLNLLDNAIKYTPAGGWVRIAAEQHPQHVRITIADNGVGIATEHLPHIFDRFYRVDVSRQRQRGNNSTGLGLAIAQEIAVHHHATLSATSTPGKGSTFSLMLPQRPTLTPFPENRYTT